MSQHLLGFLSNYVCLPNWITNTVTRSLSLSHLLLLIVYTIFPVVFLCLFSVFFIPTSCLYQATPLQDYWSVAKVAPTPSVFPISVPSPWIINTTKHKLTKNKWARTFFWLLSVIFPFLSLCPCVPHMACFQEFSIGHSWTHPFNPFYTFVPGNLAPDENPSLKRILRHRPSACECGCVLSGGASLTF